MRFFSLVRRFASIRPQTALRPTGRLLFPLFEELESRILLAAFPPPPPIVVNSNSDGPVPAGQHTLRDAINLVNAGISNAITFSLDPAHIIIAPLTPLPAIKASVTIFGESMRNGYIPVAPVIIDGSLTTGDGLDIYAGGVVVEDLNIRGFTGYGIKIASGPGAANSGGDLIFGCAITHNQKDGIFINGIPNNVVGATVPKPTDIKSTNIAGNQISYNLGNGVHIANRGATGNYVVGNLIGTDSIGGSAAGNFGDGVLIEGDSKENVIGSADIQEPGVIGPVHRGFGNIISGNLKNGIEIARSTDNRVGGNLIGLGSAGGVGRVINGSTVDTKGVVLYNVSYGIFLSNGANTNIIGGTGGTRNIISGTLAAALSYPARTRTKFWGITSARTSPVKARPTRTASGLVTL